jgi:hypothetical protein
MRRSIQIFLVTFSFLFVIDSLHAQSAPQLQRDYIYGPGGKLAATIEPDTYPPNAPLWVSATPGACAIDGVDVDWEGNGDIGSGVASFNIYRNGGFKANVSGPIWHDSSITGGSTYTYSVKVVDHAGNVGSSTSASAVHIPICTGSVQPDRFIIAGLSSHFPDVNLFGSRPSPSPGVALLRRLRFDIFELPATFAQPFNLGVSDHVHARSLDGIRRSTPSPISANAGTGGER